MVLRGSKSGLTFPEGPMEQRGIVSFGFSCASPTPTVATRVDYYINWIRSSLQEWSSDPEVRIPPGRQVNEFQIYLTILVTLNTGTHSLIYYMHHMA